MTYLSDLKRNIKKVKQLQNMKYRSEQEVFEGRYIMANNFLKQCLTSLVIRNLETETALKLISVQIKNIKKSNDRKC